MDTDAVGTITPPDSPPIPPYGPRMTRWLPALHRWLGVANRMLAAPALRWGLGPLFVSPVGGSILLLRTRGRRSGLEREAPLGYVIRDGAVYVCAGFGHRTAWLANLVAEPSVDIVLPGARLRGTAHQVTDRAEYDAVLPELIRAMGAVGRATVPGVVERGAGGTDPWFGTLPLVRIRPSGVLPGPWDPGGRGWIGLAVLEATLVWLLVVVARRR